MKCKNLFEPYQFFDFTHGTIPTFARADGVACGEEMRRIETDPKPVGFLHPIINCRKMLDLIAEAGSLAGGVFQRDANPGALCRGEYLVQPGSDEFKCCVLPGPQMC